MKDAVKVAALVRGWLGEVMRLRAWRMIRVVISGVMLVPLMMLVPLKMSASAGSASVVGKRWASMSFRLPLLESDIGGRAVVEK